MDTIMIMIIMSIGYVYFKQIFTTVGVLKYLVRAQRMLLITGTHTIYHPA